MSLKYTILWVEDNPKTVTSKINQIKTYLEDEGFDLNIILIENGNEIEQSLNIPQLDLIVTDYNIHDDLNGKQLSEKIRRLDYMTDIILYSQQQGIDLYNEVGTLDGVYISNRDTLEEKVKEVIKNTIRRTQNINNMRGIVISEAIDIERQIEAIITTFFGDKGDLVSERVLGVNIFDFNNKISLVNAVLKTIINRCVSMLQAPGSDRTLVNSQKRQAENFKNTAKALFREVGWPRNVLAHTEQSIADDGKMSLTSTLKNPDGQIETITVDSSWCKETRKLLQKHSKNLEQVFEFVRNWHEFDKL